MEETEKKKAKSAIRGKKTTYTSAEEFYRQVNEFKVANGYLLRLIEDGHNVVLSDEMRKKLYMTADDTATAFLDQSTISAEDDTGREKSKKQDPMYGMTAAQRERYKKR